MSLLTYLLLTMRLFTLELCLVQFVGYEQIFTLECDKAGAGASLGL